MSGNGSAVAAFDEIVAPGTKAGRRKRLRANLLAHCGRDTEGLLRIFRHLSDQG